MLRRLEADVETAAYDGHALPVKLKVHESLFVPLAKWAMLLTGNYRGVTVQGMRSIRDAVHADLAQSRAAYEWVRELTPPRRRSLPAPRPPRARSPRARRTSSG